MTSSTSSTSASLLISSFQPIHRTLDSREIYFSIEGSSQQWVVKARTSDCPQIKSGDFTSTLNLREAIHAYSLLRNTAIKSVTSEQIELDTSAPAHRNIVRWLHALPSSRASDLKLHDKAIKWINSLDFNDDDDEKELDRATLESLLHLAFCPHPPVCQAATAVLIKQTGIYAKALQNIFKEQKYEDFLLLETLADLFKGEYADKVFGDFTTFLVERLTSNSPLSFCLDFKAIEILKCLLEDTSSPLRKQAADQIIVLIEKVSLSPYTKDLLRNLLEKIEKEKELQSCAEAIRKKLNPENHTQTLHPLLVKFQEALKKSYCEGSASTIERFLDQAPSPIGECFIRLAVVLEEEQRHKEKLLEDSSREQNNYSTFGSIYKPENLIPFSHLFQEAADQDPYSRLLYGPAGQDPSSHVLVEGRAGIGKSTFCKFIANQWATLSPSKREEVLGSWSSKFELVIHLPLREVALELERKSLPQIIRDFYFSVGEGLTESEVKDVLFHFEEQGNVLYLLDGYDEVDRLRTNEKLKWQFSSTLLQKKHWILTSRPGFYHEKKKRHLEIVGFESADILNYIDKYFGERVDPATSLKEVIERSPFLSTIAPIPILLEFLCTIWSKNQIQKKPIDNTAALYTEIVADLFRRASKNEEESQNEWTTNEVLTDSSNQKVLHFFEELSWNGINQNILIFKPENYSETITNYREPRHAQPFATRVFQRIGLLKERTPLDKARPTAISQREYYFLHFSFQEYFAARYLARRVSNVSAENSGELKEELAKLQKEQRFRNVFVFTAGLLAQQKDDQPLNLFFDTICGKLDDDPSFYIIRQEFDLPMLCLEEVESMERVNGRAWLFGTFITSIKNYGWDFAKLLFNPRLKRIVTADDPSLDEAWEWAYVHLSDDWNLFFMNRYAVRNFLTKIKIYPRALIRQIEADLTSDIEANTARGLQWVSFLPYWDEALIQQLSCIAGYQSIQLQFYLIETLGHGESYKEKIAKILLRLLERRESELQIACLQALERLKECDWAIVEKIGSLLEDPYFMLRTTALKALCALKVTQTSIIEKIGSLLGDPEIEVRTTAIETLEKLKVPQTSITEKIGGLLEDPEIEVRTTAIKALGTLKVTQTSIIEKIGGLLEDPEIEVRTTAIKALVTLKVTQTSIIEKIGGLLEDPEIEVRTTAIKALGMLKVTQTSIIEKITGKLDSPNSAELIAALESLEKLKVIDVATLEHIGIILDDPVYTARSAAWDILF